MILIYLLLFIVSLIGIITNYNFLDYNNIFQSFNIVEATIYKETGYTTKGNLCILFIFLCIFAFIMIMRKYRIDEIKKEKENKENNEDNE